MPIFEISYNDYDEIWEISQVDWDDETRVLNAVSMTTYHVSLGYSEMQTDYSVFVKKAIIESAFVEGVRLVRDKING
jgi:hypothetical protein